MVQFRSCARWRQVRRRIGVPHPAPVRSRGEHGCRRGTEAGLVARYAQPAGHVGGRGGQAAKSAGGRGTGAITIPAADGSRCSLHPTGDGATRGAEAGSRMQQAWAWMLLWQCPERPAPVGPGQWLLPLPAMLETCRSARSPAWGCRASAWPMSTKASTQAMAARYRARTWRKARAAMDGGNPLSTEAPAVGSPSPIAPATLACP